MRKFVRILAPVIFTLAFSACGSDSGYSIMESEFKNPPSDARPRVWWHWEDGNITKDGIRKDLEWMKRAGIGGFHHFDAGLSQKPIVENRFVYMHDEWKDAFRYAINMADSLGMTVGIASSPGWSNTGGPWVSQDNAMKRLVWSTLDVEQGKIEVNIPQPKSYEGYYRDIRTVAVALPETDGAVRSIRVLGNSRRQMWNILPYKYNLILEASDNGKDFTEVARIPQTTAGSITVNFPPVSAREFRLRDIDGGEVPEYILYTRSRIEHAEEQAGFSTPYDLSSFKTKLAEGEKTASSASVIDISGMMDAEGNVNWVAPEGKWRIIRLGYTLTGKKNGPAPKEATGLEVDKLDQVAYHNYFKTYLDMYRDATGGMIGDKGITELLVDSYEAGWQTWTPKMLEEFESRRGYSMLPWLPVLTGEILDSPEASEKFLFDWRRTIADLYARSYASVKDVAAEYGIRTVCLESQENGRVFVADGMDIKRQATVPMAACWTEVEFETTHSTIPIAVADMRESASVAHLYGKQWVATESFTADGHEGHALSFTPERLKRLADTEFASGINRIFVHESSHQPLDDFRPGIGLSKYGQWFCRHETWAEQARAWTDYLARTSYMLSRGSNIADILVYYGEDSNATARYGKNMFPVPEGYNYDFINPNGLSDLKVKGGRIVAPSGASYSVLCIDTADQPQSEEVKAELDALKAAGAPICGINELSEFLKATPKDVCAPAPVRFVHRVAGKTDIYWLDNPSDETVSAEISLRCSGRKPMLWNPENGEITEISYRLEGGRTVIAPELKADDAVFIVFGPEKAEKQLIVEQQAEGDRSLALKGWTLAFPQRTLEVEDLQDYSCFPYEDVKYFSGSCDYSTSFTIDELPAHAVLDLGNVSDLCELKVNGVDMGILWRKPFKADISAALRKGENKIEIKVVNVWVNRLIGDAQPDCPQVSTYTTVKFYDADHELLPAGLLGPVCIKY